MRGPKPKETAETLAHASRLQADLRRVVAEARKVLAEQEQARDVRRAGKANRGGARD